MTHELTILKNTNTTALGGWKLPPFEGKMFVDFYKKKRNESYTVEDVSSDKKSNKMKQA